MQIDEEDSSEEEDASEKNDIPLRRKKIPELVNSDGLMSTPRNKNGTKRSQNTFSSSQSNSNSLRRGDEDLEEQKISLRRIPVVKVDSVGTELTRHETGLQENFMHQRKRTFTQSVGLPDDQT